MNVLFITHYAKLYGANLSLLSLIDELEREKINPVLLLAEKGPLLNELKNRNITYYVFPFEKWLQKANPKIKYRLLGPLSRFRNNYRLSAKCSHIIKNNNINLIYSNSVVIPFGFFLQIRYRKKHILHIREYGDLDFGLKWDYGLFLSRFIINIFPKHIITVSKDLKKRFELPFFSKKFQNIYNGIFKKSTFQKLRKNKKIKDQNDKVNFIFIGSIQKTKGYVEAVKAFSDLSAIHPHIYLTLAGEGENRNLEKLIREAYDPQRISFLGYVKDPNNLLQKMDCLLMCSKNEGLGRVTIEAIANGCFVIANNSGGSKEIIRSEKVGKFYSGTIDSLKQVMDDYINNFKNYQFVHDHNHYLEDIFSKESSAKKIENLIT